MFQPKTISDFPLVNGEFITSIEELKEILTKAKVETGYCAPSLYSEIGDKLKDSFNIEYEYARERMEDYHFGITRADAAIAESGTMILTDTYTSNRLGALSPWIHVACIYRKELIKTIGYALSTLPDDPNTIFVTGPSKTADVEGILIEGVHGPGRQICLLLG